MYNSQLLCIKCWICGCFSLWRIPDLSLDFYDKDRFWVQLPKRKRVCSSSVVAVGRAVDLATNIYKKVGVGEFCENSPHHFCHAHYCTTDNCVKGTTAVYHPCYANIGHVLSPPLFFLLPCVLTLPRVLPSTSHDLIRQTGCDTTRSTVFSTFFFSSLTSERDLFNM